MSKSNAAENDYLKLIYNATPIANIADNAATSPLANIFIALHTADPGEAGDQTTSEATYTGYVRKGVVRTTSGWTVTTNTVVNLAAVTFDQCTAGSNTITHWSTGVAASSTSKILHKGSLGSSVQGPFTGATNDNITIPGHTLVVDDRVSFYPAFGSSLPTGITEGTIYWVKTSATDVITISATQGGAVLDITAVGDGVCFKAAVLAVSAGITPEFAASAIQIQED